MKLPTPQYLATLKPEDRFVLGAFYDIFHKRGWFEEAKIVYDHFETLAPKTLEVRCSYFSSFDHPLMRDFATSRGLALYLVLPKDPDIQAVNRNNPLNREITKGELT